MTAPFIKAAVVAVCASLCCVIMRRGSPEQGVILAISACVAAVMLCISMLTQVIETAKKAADLTGMSAAVYAPVIRCTGIGILAKLAGDLCRDAGQSAEAGAVELAGACAAMYSALPLISILIDCVGELL